MSAAIDPSVSFDPYSTSLDCCQPQECSDLSPMSKVFDSLDDFGSDFTSESAPSPVSPPSPALSASWFAIPATDPWTAWDAAKFFPLESDSLYACQHLDVAALASWSPAQSPSLSPSINPMQLAMEYPATGSPQVLLPQQQQKRQQQQQTLPMAARPTTPLTPPTTTTTTTTTTSNAAAPTAQQQATRYPSRGLKRKSISSPATPEDDDDNEQPPAKTAPATRRSSSSHHHKTGGAAGNNNNSSSSSSNNNSPKKTAHNMIEKRYRNNLNDKILQLRDAVPALRAMAQRAARHADDGAAAAAATTPSAADGPAGADLEGCEGEAGSDDGCWLMEQGSGGGPQGGAVAAAAGKLNKATILSKATEYIMQLERSNRGLQAENTALRGRMEGLEILLGGSGGVPAVAEGWN